VVIGGVAYYPADKNFLGLKQHDRLLAFYLLRESTEAVPVPERKSGPGKLVG